MKLRQVMGQDNPLLLVGMIVASAVMAKWWWGDLRLARNGRPNTQALPGATPTNAAAVIIATGVTLLLLSLETMGEYRLGLTAQQSHMTALFALYTLAASFLEELVFRGFLVVEKKGRAALLAGIFGASLLFALLHPFLWTWQDGRIDFHGDTKAWFSTSLVLAGSLWFYAVRFMPLNPTRSLLPCIAAHAAKNLGVFAIKYAQGYVSNWW